MISGEEIFEAYQKRSGFSGSKIDSYVQNLTTFLFHAKVQGKANVFYQLLAQAEKENKMIGFIEPAEEILYDDYPVEGLILINKSFKG